MGIFKVHVTAVYINSNFKRCKNLRSFYDLTKWQHPFGLHKNSATVDLLVCGTVTLSLFPLSSRDGECVYAYTIPSHFAKAVTPGRSLKKHFAT